MEKKFKLESFNLEKAKAGEPVCTRGGKDVRIICYDRNCEFFPIVALVGKKELLMAYTSNGSFSNRGGKSEDDLMMKVEVKEPYIYAELAGEIIPFEKLKTEGFIDLKSLDYLIIKTYDSKFLKVWKKNLHEQEWEEAQAAASSLGDGWRCPTRHECIDLYDARYKGLDDAMKEIGGEPLKEVYWTSEADSAPQCNAEFARIFSGCIGELPTSYKCIPYSVRPVYSFVLEF